MFAATLRMRPQRAQLRSNPVTGAPRRGLLVMIVQPCGSEVIFGQAVRTGSQLPRFSGTPSLDVLVFVSANVYLIVRTVYRADGGCVKSMPDRYRKLGKSSSSMRHRRFSLRLFGNLVRKWWLRLEWLTAD
jgi:hypothetical protein